MERFTRMQAWIDILLECNHKTRLILIRGNEINISRGQSANSILTWSKRWKWNRRTVDRFLKWLVKREMIHCRKSHITTIVTVVKYEQYQDSTQQSAQQSNNRVHTNKNDKNEKNIKTVVEYLNKKTGKSFKDTTISTKKHINARLNEGYTLNNLKAVVDDKVLQWLGNSEMDEYLRPDTLFGTKFEGYLQKTNKEGKIKKTMYTYKCPDNCKDDKDYETDMDNTWTTCTVCGKDRIKV